MADNPRPSGVVKLENTDNKYRIRVGNYRILYEIQDDVLIVKVVRVGHRRDGEHPTFLITVIASETK
ncbi:type II toxin-antitoxin system RelE family toxin [Nostoc sp.]|uniref:type II toxin-antitoxin system RelE family toxin n=1 Tax=Nostoc sp. TaxID=1180 RepID=UPI003FA55206